MRGSGRDRRYLSNARPVGLRSWMEFSTPRALLNSIASDVHSGYFRTAPDVENADFYQAAIAPGAIRPGTTYYAPNGHVLIVYEIQPDGEVLMFDGHPDNSVTPSSLTRRHIIGSARQGGGFKNFRPQSWINGRLVRAPNRVLADFDGTSEYDARRFVVAGQQATYHAWVRASLSTSNTPVDPVTEFREQVRALCRDVHDRVDAVQFAINAQLHERPHPGALPSNIYGTEGDWEIYSTPSRDARLKAAFRELRETMAALPGTPALGAQLQAAWFEETARPECQFTYVNSRGAPVIITMDTVLDRLFTMSFDPYHCPELRWGAPEGSPERATCPDGADKLVWYRNEQRLRNRIDREYGRPTPLDFGPTVADDVDVRRLLRSLQRMASLTGH
jgi:hypothetical protein